MASAMMSFVPFKFYFRLVYNIALQWAPLCPSLQLPCFLLQISGFSAQNRLKIFSCPTVFAFVNNKQTI